MLKKSIKENNKKSVYVLVFSIPFLMGFGVDLYVPSLPKITTYFKSTDSLVQLTVSLYLLGYGIGQIILGVLSDNFGRRRILLISSIGFSLISLISIFSPNLMFLEINRFLQGIFIAGLAVTSRAMIVDVFSGIEVSKLSNYFTLSWSLGPIVAPFIGGILAKYFGWKSNFYLFFIYSLIIFIYALLKFKETNLNLDQFSIKATFKDIYTISTDKVFVFITIISASGYAAIVLFNTVGPFIIEISLKYSVEAYGNIAMILGCAYFCGAMSNRFFITRFKLENLLAFGIMMTILGSLIMLGVFMKFGFSLIAVLVPIFFIFYCVGFIVPNALARTMNMFSEKAGLASAIFGVITGIVVFLVTVYGGKLNTSNQFQLSLAYLILFILSLVIFFIASKLEKLSEGEI